MVEMYAAIRPRHAPMQAPCKPHAKTFSPMLGASHLFVTCDSPAVISI